MDIDVEIDDNNPIHGVPGCDRYYARIVKDFNPNAHTPNWMRRRLIRAGMRSISLACLLYTSRDRPGDPLPSVAAHLAHPAP